MYAGGLGGGLLFLGGAGFTAADATEPVEVGVGVAMAVLGAALIWLAIRCNRSRREERRRTIDEYTHYAGARLRTSP